MKTAKPVIGSGGDFITSPEISQVFGEVGRPTRTTRASVITTTQHCN